MAHKIIETLISFMGFVGVIGFLIGFMFIAIDVIDVYLRIRERVNRHDFLKRKDRE